MSEPSSPSLAGAGQSAPAAEVGLVVVLTGPSGAGKSTIVNAARGRVPGIGFSVSYTTRPMRKTEENGVDYHFVAPAEFEQLRDSGQLLEHAIVHTNQYGTHRGQVEESVAGGAVILLDIDVQGARQVRGSGVDAVFVFILPPGLAELERRLRGRGTDSNEVIEGRLGVAAREMSESPWFDYLVVNDHVDAATDSLVALIHAERLRRSRAAICARVGLPFQGL